LGNQTEFRERRKDVWSLKLRLSVLNVVVCDLGKMVFGKLVKELCSDTIAEIVITGFPAEIQCSTHNVPLFSFSSIGVGSDV